MHIYGASGHAKVILESLLSVGEPIDGIYDDDPKVRSILGYSVRGRLLDSYINSIDSLIIAIGNNDIRETISARLKVSYGNAIHKKSIISPSVELGKGVAIMANSVIVGGGSTITKDIPDNAVVVGYNKIIKKND